LSPGSVVVSGVGQTSYTGSRGRSALDLTLESVLFACADAGISPVQLDGIISYPNGPTAEDIVVNVGVADLRFTSTIHLGGASAVASLLHATLAIEAGLAQHVLISRVRTNFSGKRVNQAPSQAPGQVFRRQLEEPYGINTPAQRYALLCQRYMHEYGLTREQLGHVAIAARQHANLNPAAQMFGRSLDMQTYLAGRVIAEPYRLYDCCLETDGACAVIVSAAESVAGTSRRQAVVRAVAVGHPDTPDDLTNRPNFLSIGLERAAPRVWEAAGLGPKDMDAAMVYDCFTFEVVHQLEAAGFAGKGEGGRFVEEHGIGPGARLPVNTHGGLLSEGHLLGLNHVVEAVRQIRREAGERQLARAESIAVIGWGDLGDGSIAVIGAGR
jgi:acetyl-CoA acetyltransferase